MNDPLFSVIFDNLQVLVRGYELLFMLTLFMLLILVYMLMIDTINFNLKLSIFYLVALEEF